MHKIDFKAFIIEKTNVLDGNAYIVWISIDNNDNEYAFFYDGKNSLVIPSQENSSFWNDLNNNTKDDIIKYLIKLINNDNK